MRSAILGLVLATFFSLTVLSLRPGGLRRQLKFLGRRFRILLVLGGIYIGISTAIRIFFSEGFVADWGPPLAAGVLLVVFLVVARDPVEQASPPSRSNQR